MKSLYTLILYFLIFFVEANASNISSIWYFGKNSGLDFNNVNSEPLLLKDGQVNSYEGCATISDTNGNLLFYTNGQFVWNKKHRLLNPNRIIGNPSSTMTAIVPVPENDSIYYALTVDYAGNHNMPRGFTCTHLNTNLINGDGGIFWQQDTIADEFLTEKIAVTKHGNGRDYWIVLHEINNNNFRSYLLTPDGIDSNYVTSSAGSIHIFDVQDRTDAIGYMKISQQGTKLALVKHENYYLELFDFDPFTGKVSNDKSFYIPDRDDEYTVYGVEFSPNGKKLYASIYKVFWITDPDNPRQGYSHIYQWDLQSNNTDSIRNSKKLVFNYPNSEKDFGTFKAMQLAPDKKIYIARTDYSYLSVINEPDREADSCGFELKGFYLEKTKSYSGLPNLISGMVFPIPKLLYESPLIADEYNCSGNKIFKEFLITNSGTKSVLFNFDSVKFESKKFKIESITGDSVLHYNDSISIIMSFQPDINDNGIFQDTFYLMHNDSIFIDINPIPIEFIVNLTNINTEFEDIDKNPLPDTLDLGIISINDTSTTSILVSNLSDIDLNIRKIVLDSEYYSLTLADSIINFNDFSELNLRFIPDTVGIYYADLYVFIAQCFDPIDTLHIKIEATENYIISHSNLDFGILSECDMKTDSILFVNISKKDIKILEFSKKYQNIAFDIINNHTPQIIYPEDSLYIKIEYNPVIKGSRDSNYIYFKTDLQNNSIDSVFVFGESDTLNFEYPDTLNFGDMLLGSSTIKNIELINTGKLERVISNIEHKVNIISYSDLYKIKPNDTSNVEINFNASAPGVFTDTVKIIFNEPCADTIQIIIKANIIYISLDAPKLINFGKISFCSNPVKTFQLQNTGNIDIQIDSLKFTNDFFFSNNILPENILKNDSLLISVNFDYGKAEDGIISDSLIIMYSYSGIKHSFAIPVEANKYSVKPVIIYDKNTLESEIFNSEIIKIELQNKSKNDIFISKINLPPDFILKDDYNILLRNNETKSINFEYIPQKTGKQTHQIVFSFSDSLCIMSDTIDISTFNYANVFLSIEEKTGDIGSKDFKIPIKAHHNYNAMVLKNIEFETDLILPSDFFYLDKVSGDADLNNISYFGNSQIISVSGTIAELDDIEKNVFELNGTLLLNSEDSADVIFDNIIYPDNIIITGISGKIFNNGACAQNFTKLNLLKKANLEISSNSETIRIILSNNINEKAKLSIYNINGIMVFSDIIQVNSNKITLDIPNNYSTGLYNFVLKSQNGIILQKHLIIK